jgi:sulfoxide reductase heme-binding subunit YedZ
LIAAMALTSNDKAVAWLGPRVWKTLHTIGGLYIWGAFFKAMFVRTAGGPLYWAAVVILIAALALRIVAWLPVRAATRAS